MLNLIELVKIFIHILLVYSVQKRIIFVLPVYIAVLYIVRKLYIQTSRRLRALDMESRSALFGSFLETVSWPIYPRLLDENSIS